MSAAMAVKVPLPGAPTARMSDFLAAGETTAWKLGVTAADIPALGAAMAADPSVAKCGVARLWNWGLSKTDIVDTLTEVPASTIESQLTAFTTGGFKLKDLVIAIFTADAFVKY
jgi:hypothetical protein